MPKQMLMSDCKIITDCGRRRRWSSAEKLLIVEETLEDGTSISVVAGKKQADASRLFLKSPRSLARIDLQAQNKR